MWSNSEYNWPNAQRIWANAQRIWPNERAFDQTLRCAFGQMPHVLSIGQMLSAFSQMR